MPMPVPVPAFLISATAALPMPAALEEATRCCQVQLTKTPASVTHIIKWGLVKFVYSCCLDQETLVSEFATKYGDILGSRA